jgi:heme/copper-type cytochrome/quinol oxidase subunit 2
MWIIIGAAAGVAIIVLAVIIVACVKCRKKNDIEEPSILSDKLLGDASFDYNA